MRWLMLGLLVLALVGCSRLGCGGEPIGARSGQVGVSVMPVVTKASGLSGLGVDPDGVLWTVAEQERVMLELGLDGLVRRRVTLLGVPEGADTESLAWISPDTVAFGLEAPGAAGTVKVKGKPCDIAMFKVNRTSRTARRVRCLAFPYPRFGITPGRNHGIEALCSAGSTLVAVSETVVQQGDLRLAPLATHDLRGSGWRTALLRLSSDAEQQGKISTVACRTDAGERISAWAVERHFLVTRLLSFDVIAGKDGAAIVPAAVRDIRPLFDGSPNFEGLVRQSDGGFVLINDSRYGKKRVETVLATLAAAR